MGIMESKATSGHGAGGGERELVANADILVIEEKSLEPPAPIGRDKLGRFQKGMPSVRKGKKLPDIGPAIESIQRAFPSEDIGARMLEVWELARKTNSAKAMLSVLELALAYQFGKPVQRQLSVGATLDEFRALFASEEEQASEEGEIIDVSVE